MEAWKYKVLCQIEVGLNLVLVIDLVVSGEISHTVHFLPANRKMFIPTWEVLLILSLFLQILLIK